MDTVIVMNKLRLATVWLCGCSGCHMSFLDLDEWLIDLAAQVEVVFSPVGSDVKTYPKNVDVCLVEGGVANEENLALIREVRQRTRWLISFGDCAVTANVPAMRNWLKGPAEVLERCYIDLADVAPQAPRAPGIVPPLLDRVVPVHEVVAVDAFIPGCPPDAPRIRAALESLLQGHLPVLTGREQLKFG